MKKVERRSSRFGPITIEEDVRTGAIAYVQGGYFQSQADRNGVSLLIYVQAIFGLMAQKRYQRVLMIGCAGGSLATMLSRSGARITAIDINPHAFALARRYFGLPDSVECRIADAVEFVSGSRRTFDAIVLDAFHGGRMDTILLSKHFLSACRKRLAPGGAVFVNVHVRNDADDAADRMAAALRSEFRKVRILDRPRAKYRNAVVMAGAVGGLKKPELAMIPDTDAHRIATVLARMRFKAEPGGVQE